ncbi:MAG: hypothetical protein H8E38_06880 [SAR324 cluster bacterium]|nr:hypothetical protein [SAR324 cluster bacterium]MBL7035386.1 hypothetical protein [SAR324 cluster bacterium]
MKQNKSSFSRPIFYTSFSLLFFLLSACKTTDLKDKANLLPYMQKPVAFLTIKSPKNLETVWPELMDRIEQRLRDLPALGKVEGVKEINQKLKNNPKLLTQFRSYLSTLTLTGISEKELAWKLEDELNSPYFLLLDLVSFPCTKECPSNEQWVVRLKLIEAHSGEQVYRVRLQHKLDEDEKTAESYSELAAKLTAEVVDEFAAGFIVPWHRWRYEHLKPATERTLRSKTGI